MKIIIFLSFIISTIFSVNGQEAEFNITDETFNFNSKIVGGSNAAANQFPYQAGLKIATADTTAFCGGALISQNYVLTAAQCVDGAATVVVVLGALDISDTTSGISLVASQFIIYPKYDSADLEYDIALIRLPTTVTITAAIKPIWLPSIRRKVEAYEGQLATVSGWGATDPTGTPATILQFLQTPVIARDECDNINNREINHKNICTSGVDDIGTCIADSGDPLTATVNGVTRLIGIASYGFNACSQNYPSVFTRVSPFLPWIIRNTGIDPRDQL